MFVSTLIAPLFAITLAGVSPHWPAQPAPPKLDSDWQLVWRDEFDGDRLDPLCWAPFTARSGNNPVDEAQRFTAAPENHAVKNGILTIRAIKETTEVDGQVKHFTSAQVMTENLASWRYARFEARIKVPEGAGFWPAFWMMPQDDKYGGWPKGGEVDIMEMIGREPNRTIAVAHFHNFQKNAHRTQDSEWLNPTPLHQDFHVYTLDWTPNRMVWSFDGVPFFEAKDWPSPPGGGYGAPFDQPFYLILNLSVGGKWSGLPTKSTKFPAELQVDYVRVYQKPDQVKGAPAQCNGHDATSGISPLQTQTG